MGALFPWVRRNRVVFAITWIVAATGTYFTLEEAWKRVVGRPASSSDMPRPPRIEWSDATFIYPVKAQLKFAGCTLSCAVLRVAGTNMAVITLGEEEHQAFYGNKPPEGCELYSERFQNPDRIDISS